MYILGHYIYYEANDINPQSVIMHFELVIHSSVRLAEIY